MRRVNEARLLSWAVALRLAQRPQAAALVAEASLVVALTLAATVRAAPIARVAATTRAVIRRIPVARMDLIRIKPEKAINF